MLRQMFAGYGAEITEDRLGFYLEMLKRVPLHALPAAIKSAAGSSGNFAPGPGSILGAHQFHAQHHIPEPTERQIGMQLGAGEARHQIASVIDDSRVEPSLAELVRRAREIRAEGKFVPTAWYPGHLLSCIKAAQELGTTWKIGVVWPQARQVLSAAMRAHEAAGGEARWWWQECERPTVTR